LKYTTRPMRSVCRTALAIGCLLALSGCGEVGSPGDKRGQVEEHVGHVIPAHKPKSFPDAVRKLRELSDQIGRDVVQGQTDPKTLHVALDVATWLPEIAADSDMPEVQWNAVNSQSTALVENIKEVLSGSSGNVRRAVEDANVEIGKLEQLLLASDPRWFGGSDRGGAAPPSGTSVILIKSPTALDDRR
jgi:hypothetical protein